MERKCLNCLYQHTPCPPLGDMDTNCNWISAYHKWQPKEQILEKKCSNCRYDLIGCPSGDPYCGHSNSYCKWESDDCPDCKKLNSEAEYQKKVVEALYNDKCRLAEDVKSTKEAARIAQRINKQLKEMIADRDATISNLAFKLEFVNDTYNDVISRLTRRYKCQD